jgi:microsomal dipeptidase-like Zn-dependent dipeptidase
MAMRDVIGPGSVERLVDHIDYVVERIGIDHVGIGLTLITAVVSRVLMSE